MAGPPRAAAPIERIEVAAYRIPTEAPESDGTYAWSATTLVAVWADAGGQRGFGYTYADEAAARVVHGVLADAVRGRDALDVPAAWGAAVGAIRNLGRPGVGAMAVSGLDAALWDLKARLLGVPLAALLGRAREAIPIYGSGGFTSYPVERLREQLAGWADEGMGMVKMKVGRDPAADLDRAAAARQAIGERVALFVDANGAYRRKQALALAEGFARLGITWLEEPVSSDDLDGLRLLRDRAPAPVEIAAGEYGYDARYFRRMLERGAVDVLQADATRCLGITGFMQAAALAAAHGVPLSSHCAPALHVAPMCAAETGVHAEYFHDHVLIERRFMDGAPVPAGGVLRPDGGRPGLGLSLRRPDLERYAV